MVLDVPKVLMTQILGNLFKIEVNNAKMKIN